MNIQDIQNRTARVQNRQCRVPEWKATIHYAGEIGHKHDTGIIIRIPLARIEEDNGSQHIVTDDELRDALGTTIQKAQEATRTGPPSKETVNVPELPSVDKIMEIIFPDYLQHA